MRARDRLVAVLPWTLCWISVALLAAGLGVRAAFPEAPEDEVILLVTGFLVAASVPLVGALIATRMPTNPYGWLWCALGISFGVQICCEGLRQTDALPEWLLWGLIGSTFPVGLCILVLVLLLFPTGRVPSRSWRWLARVAVLVAGAAVVLLPFALPAEVATPWASEGRVSRVLADLLGRAVAVMFLLILVAAGSVLVRFRRAGAVERQQLKWFLLAAAINAATTLVDLLDVPVGATVWAVVDELTFAALPVAVGIAVLRYRLFEIDRIISRTVSYGLLTAGVIGLYLLVVALLRPLLEPLTGSSSLAVAGSTLAVAAVFNPARRRLQEAVDRRFDRSRYDAARAVDAFAGRLRNQVDLDQVTAGLRDTVVATVAPTRVAVWLRVPSRSET